jgi:hypothetical protein
MQFTAESTADHLDVRCFLVEGRRGLSRGVDVEADTARVFRSCIDSVVNVC